MFNFQSVKNFSELTRAYSLPASIAPYFTALAWGSIMVPCAINIILSFIAIICLHLGGNLFDDFIDVQLRLKKGENLGEITFCKGKNKARLIVEGTYSLKQVFTIVSALFLIPILIGVYFFTLYGAPVLQIALIGGALCLLYPISSKFYLGEIIIGILFGILLPKGVYLVLTGYSSLNLFHFSISLALLIVALAHTHSIMDWEFDEKNGKNTLARLCGTKKNAIVALGWMITLAFLNLGALISMYYVPTALVLAFLTAPIGFELVKSMDDYINIRNVKFQPKWWMGIMENWGQILVENRAFFMYRFYLARNLALYFAVISGLAFYYSVIY